MRVRLRKWYLDASSPDGRTALIYVGEARIAGLTLHFFEIFVAAPDRVSCHASRLALSIQAFVTESADAVSIDAPAFGVGGQWLGTPSPLNVALHESPAAQIRWRRPQPCARVRLQLPGGDCLEGTGYAEHLSVDTTTAGLPFQEIRWGRFIGDPHHVTWIAWAGATPRRWVFANDEAVAATVVSKERVEWAGGALAIAPGLTIREGPIAEGIAGRCASILPRRLMAARESRWIGAAHLHGGGRDADGSVIHEVVTWA